MAATALIQPLAWELPYPVGAALKREKKKKIDEVILGSKLLSCPPGLWPPHCSRGAALEEASGVRTTRPLKVRTWVPAPPEGPPHGELLPKGCVGLCF